MNKNGTTPVQMAIRIVVIFIAIVVLLLISFAMIKLIPSVFSSIARFRETLSFFGKKERLVASFNEKAINSGDRSVLSWRQQDGENEGKYTIEYSCDAIDDDTRLEILKGDEDSDTLFCEEERSLDGVEPTNGEHSLTIEGFSEVSEDQVIKVVISHQEATSTLASSTANITIRGIEEEDEGENNEPVAKPATSTPVKPTTTTPPAPKPTYTYQPATPADLFVIFTRTDVDDEDALVEFQVTNFGGTASGRWRFEADLPRDGDTSYTSPYQSSIPAGKTSIMTLRFNKFEDGTMTVRIDPNNEIRESNENNNRASVNID